MATPDTITVAQLAQLIGTPESPLVIDVRIDTDHAADQRMLPASVRRSHKDVSSWAGEYAGRFVVVVCQWGKKLSQGVASWLRHAGASAENLEGGFDAWVKANGLLVRPDHVPPRDAQGRTLWVANITLPKWIDKPLSYFIVSPAMHKVHHHWQQPYTDSNYGAVLSIWDRLFGTYAQLDPSQIRYGLDRYYPNEQDENLGMLMRKPFQKMK